MRFFGEGTERAKGIRTRGGDEEEGDSGNSALAEARTSGSPAQSACRLGPPYQISSTIIRLMLLRRRPAHWKSYSCGTRLNTLQQGGQNWNTEQNQSHAQWNQDIRFHPVSLYFRHFSHKKKKCMNFVTECPGMMVLDQG